jgi:hypothetical protein
MFSLAEEDKKKQGKIIRKMTYNEELRQKACSNFEEKDVKLESNVNYLKSACKEKMKKYRRCRVKLITK